MAMMYKLQDDSFDDFSVPLFPQDVFYQDPAIVAGLTKYPIAPGHVVIRCQEYGNLMAADSLKFSRIMLTVSEVASTLSSAWHTHRCGLTYDGGRTISIVPLHGVGKDWNPIIHDVLEFHSGFPGYLTSKNGPQMDDAVLAETQSRVAKVSGISQPFDTTFHGETTDENLFARIVRGELPQWRIWEDDSHIAFLTPFGNTTGFTVVVPRRHLGSDIFALSPPDYTAMIKAAHTVAQHLKTAFGVDRCGMFFEGYEIDYAHIKLVPVHSRTSSGASSFVTNIEAAEFHDKYQGYLTTLPGQLTSDPQSMTVQAQKLRKHYTQ